MANEEANSVAKLQASLALASQDSSPVEFLADHLIIVKAEDLPGIVLFLKPHAGKLAERLWEIVATGNSSERLHAAVALSTYDPQSQQ